MTTVFGGPEAAVHSVVSRADASPPSSGLAVYVDRTTPPVAGTVVSVAASTVTA